MSLFVVVVVVSKNYLAFLPSNANGGGRGRGQKKKKGGEKERERERCIFIITSLI